MTDPESKAWSAFYDDEGRLYYHNSETGESSWEPPEEGFHPPPPPSNASWVAYQDDEGRTYYFNTETEETQWEKPEGFVEEEAAPEGGGEAMDAAPETAPEDPIVTESKPPQDEDVVMEDEVEQPTVEPEDEPPEPEEPPVDPAVLRLAQAKEALGRPDSVLEPNCMTHVTEVVTADDGNPQNAIAALIDNYQGQSAVCGLLGKWVTDLRAADNRRTTKSSSSSLKDLIQNLIHRIVHETFTKEAGDGILGLSKKDASFLEDMMDAPRWRKLLIELSAMSQYKDSAVLLYCLKAISKRGHHREIARRVNQSEHFAVFNAMLSSELAVIARLAVAAEGDPASSIALDEIVNDLKRACTSTSYTYLYSLELLKQLQRQDGDQSPRFQRALRKWERLRECLEAVMIDPTTSAALAGSSPLFRKRRLDVALTVSDLYQQKKAKGENGGSLESALLNLLRRYAIGIQIDDAALDPLLPTGLNSREASARVGSMIIQHPVAVEALLSYLYKPGSSRVTLTIVKNKCARLLALAVVAAEKKKAVDETSNSFELSDDLAVSRHILQGSQLCEQMESMVSFLVSEKPDPKSLSPGQKLCSLAFSSPVVARGIAIWANAFTRGPEFASSASFPTLSVSILSLLRLLCIWQPFTRRLVLDTTLAFLRHSNPDVSYQKVTAIKEQSLRVLIFLVIHGEVVPVMDSVASRLEHSGASELDASLVRYFVTGLLQVIQPPVSLTFVRAFGKLLLTSRCTDAVKSPYFTEKEKLAALLSAFADQRTSPGWNSTDASQLTKIQSTYGG